MKMVKKLLPVEPLDIPQAEGYFQAMAAKGLLVRRVGALVWFEQGEPQRLTYRLDPAAPGQPRPTEEQLAGYADYGWDYVCTLPPGLHLYQNSREDPVEIHTDPVAHSLAFEAIARRIKTGSLVCMILLPLAILMTLFAFFGNGHPVLYAVRYGQTAMVSMLLVDVFLVGQLFQTRRRLLALVGRLQRGIPFPHKRGYRSSGWAVVYPVVVLVLAVLSISTSLWRMLSPWEKDLADYQGPLPTVTLEQVEGTSLEPVEAGPFDQLTYQWSELAPEMYRVGQKGAIEGKSWQDGSGTYSPALQTELYRLRFPWLAAPLLQELAKDELELFRFAPVTYQELTDSPFDQALLIHSGETKMLFARWQGQVIYVRYHGERELAPFVETIFQAMVKW